MQEMRALCVSGPHCLILHLHSAYGLRDAHAYVLVYDMLNPESFEYITNLFHQGCLDSSGQT